MKNYEHLYRDQKEPWGYSERAVERLRHTALAERVQKALSDTSDKSLLELGCSKGLLSQQLLPMTEYFAALEISESALEEAKRRLAGMEHKGILEFQKGSALSLPFPDDTFQLVLAADGIHEWGFSENEKQKVYSEIFRVLKSGGLAVFSDYLKPQWFADVLEQFQKSNFQLVEVEYFGDRLSYQLEASLKAFQGMPWAKKITSSVFLARKLQVLGKWLGPSGSRHMIWVGRKREG